LQRLSTRGVQKPGQATERARGAPPHASQTAAGRPLPCTRAAGWRRGVTRRGSRGEGRELNPSSPPLALNAARSARPCPTSTANTSVLRGRPPTPAIVPPGPARRCHASTTSALRPGLRARADGVMGVKGRRAGTGQRRAMALSPAPHGPRVLWRSWPKPLQPWTFVSCDPCSPVDQVTELFRPEVAVGAHADAADVLMSHHALVGHLAAGGGVFGGRAPSRGGPLPKTPMQNGF
jgi:hypothetical protein